MKKLFLLALLGLLAACGPPGPPGPPPPTPAESPETVSWSFAPGAIRVGLLADADLNVVEDGPTGLALCLYQLAEPSAVMALAQTRAGLVGLLACSPEAKGVVSSERIYVQPGQRSDLVLDRLEKTRYLAVVAGYRELRPNFSAAVLPIPLEESREYFLFKRYAPQAFEAWLKLKAQNLQFFPKTPKDYGRLAKDAGDPVPGPASFPRPKSPTLATPGERDVKAAAKAARAVPWPGPENDDGPGPFGANR